MLMLCPTKAKNPEEMFGRETTTTTNSAMMAERVNLIFSI
jgi:hypothetical protein